jgi:acetyl/propionyl-CoA carboxylase alpha subunit
MKTVALSHASQQAPLSVVLVPTGKSGDDRYAVRIGEDAVEIAVQRSGPGNGVLHMGDGVYPYHAVRRKDWLHVWLSGRTYAFEVVDGTRRSTPAAAMGVLADLTAPMPGTVRAVRVVEGDIFAAHDPLVVLESMKMEMALSAPAEGRVREILCAAGDLVEMGAVLVRLEGAGSDDGHIS